MEPRKDYHAPMHTAEHILNKTMVDMYGCERSTNSHIERKKSKCDYHISIEPTEEEINTIQNKVKEIISQNLAVHEEILDFKTAVAKFNLSRITKEENPTVRIIKIGNFDACPCIGDHVTNTSEISEFRITTTSFNAGVFRVRFKVSNYPPK